MNINITDTTDELESILENINKYNNELCETYWNSNASKEYLQYMNMLKIKISLSLSFQLKKLSEIDKKIKEIIEIDKIINENNLKNLESNNQQQKILKKLKFKEIDDILYSIEIKSSENINVLINLKRETNPILNNTYINFKKDN